jgi:hypothetical protein
MKIWAMALHPKGHWRLRRKWPATPVEVDLYEVELAAILADAEIITGRNAIECEEKREARRVADDELRARRSALATEAERDERRGGPRRSEVAGSSRELFGHE